MKYTVILRRIFFFLNLLFTIPTSNAQEATQSIRGVVIDNATNEPVPDVTVELLNHIPLKMGLTNDRGVFRIQDVPVGKHRLLATHDKYEIVIIPEVDVLAGKEPEANISLEKLPAELAEIVVSASKIRKATKDKPMNHMALTGIRSFTIEEVKRYPLSLDDPSRLVSRFAGVNKANEATGLVVRGHNPKSVLWRIEGLPISSPNHVYFNEGTSGYLPIFNIYLLRNSDFMYGIYPAEYGNALGGLLDIGLREGNYNSYEGSFKFGLFGVEGFLEGPLNKNKNISMIIGGRFNPISLLRGHIGGVLGRVPSTTDFSFKLTANTGKDKLTVFGTGGLSNTILKPNELDTNQIGSEYLYDFQKDKVYLLGGIGYKKSLKKKGYIYTTIGANYNHENQIAFDSTYYIDEIDSRTIATTLNSYLHYVPHSKHQVRTGITATHYYLNFRSENFDESIVRRNYEGHTMLLQIHAQWLYNISRKLKINLGVNGQYLLFNNDYAISPRFALSWQLMASHRISLGYAWNHQMQNWETYLNRSQRKQDFGQMVDQNLRFNKNHHISLTYDWAIINNLRLRLEGYFQYLYDLPMNQVISNASPFFTVTEVENLLAWTHFSNTGVGRSYGIELTVEKFFSQGYYGLLTATFFDMKFKNGNQQWQNTEFNNQFMSDLLFGKEFRMGKEKNNRFFIDIAYSFRLGNYYTPVELAASLATERQVLDWDSAYSLRYPALHNLDLRLGFVFNQKKKATSHRILIEINNVLNQKIPYREVYNPTKKTVATHSYLGLIPNLSYRLNFGFKPKEKRIIN